MRYFRLVLSEKRGEYYFDSIHEKFVHAQNRNKAYKKALKIAATFFKNYKNAPTGIPDEDTIFWFNGDYAAIWINDLKEIEMI
ncbi:MAG: hypothetical protein ACTSSP_10445 [Candidatus Asgardarchaeia archaeon]